MSLRTPRQERWAIWAEKMLGKIEAGEPFELPTAYANAAQRAVARGVEAAALDHDYLRHSPLDGKVRFVHRRPVFAWNGETPGYGEEHGKTTGTAAA